MVRTRRWAMTASTDEATRNGSMPMSIKPGESAGRIVGVQRAEDQVAGQRGADGDFRRFEVANFSRP